MQKSTQLYGTQSGCKATQQILGIIPHNPLLEGSPPHALMTMASSLGRSPDTLRLLGSSFSLIYSLNRYVLSTYSVRQCSKGLALTVERKQTTNFLLLKDLLSQSIFSTTFVPLDYSNNYLRGNIRSPKCKHYS